MVNYKCSLCNYTTKIKGSYNIHLKSKKHMKNEKNINEDNFNKIKLKNISDIFELTNKSLLDEINIIHTQIKNNLNNDIIIDNYSKEELDKFYKNKIIKLNNLYNKKQELLETIFCEKIEKSNNIINLNNDLIKKQTELMNKSKNDFEEKLEMYEEVMRDYNLIIS